MCGISGFINFDKKKINKGILEKFGKILSHRGPDNTGLYYNDFVGLCHNRLSILDLSVNGNQPRTDGRYYLVYNGEIYNYLILKKDLDDLNINFSSSSDTEVLFLYLIHFGIETTLKKIEGMFAFAFYDSKKDDLFLARDRFGIKPLFYAIKDRTLFFASEMKALTKQIPFELDQFRALYSVLGIIDKSKYETIFKGLFHIPPGSYLRFHNKRIEKNTYFKLSDFINAEKYNERKKRSFNENVEEFDYLFNRSVDKMLMSDAPMGAFVSGGVDSSLIASYVNKNKDNEFKLFTANVIGRYSEFQDAKSLAHELDRKLYSYKFRPEYLIRDFTKASWHYETPILIHANAMPLLNISALAQSENVKAVLTGEGADELFLGYPHLLTQKIDFLIKSPFKILNYIYSINRHLKKYVLNSHYKELNELIVKSSESFGQDFMKNNTLEMLSFLPRKERETQYLSIELLSSSLLTLLWRNDRMGMMHSIESRFPFLDEDLIEFGINLPVKNKIGLTSKFYNFRHPFQIDKKIIRHCAKKSLPKKLSFKKKEGFPLNGLPNLRFNPKFFENGFISDLLGLTRKDQIHYFANNANKYNIAKFGAIEIWAKLFVLNNSIEDVENIVKNNLTMKNVI